MPDNSSHTRRSCRFFAPLRWPPRPLPASSGKAQRKSPPCETIARPVFGKFRPKRSLRAPTATRRCVRGRNFPAPPSHRNRARKNSIRSAPPSPPRRAPPIAPATGPLLPDKSGPRAAAPPDRSQTPSPRPCPGRSSASIPAPRCIPRRPRTLQSCEPSRCASHPGRTAPSPRPGSRGPSGIPFSA